MEGSRLQKLEKLRELTQRYAEVAAELGIVEDPTARSLVMDVLKEKVREKNLQVVLAGPERRMRVQFRIPTVIELPTIVAGAPCEKCGHAILTLTANGETSPSGRVEAMPRLRPPLRSDRVNSGNEMVVVTPKRPLFKPIPYISREESIKLTNDLIDALIRNPDYPREPRYGCFNCGDPAHSAKECKLPRGTWCGRCGEVGMLHANCPRCYPEQYGLKIKPFTNRRR
ncbi:hypothetical protein PV328_011876 [Microctonus aethiopoides]|uniref:CCHC-type domain-containing protein n=1 Tax=Microctonus aethiopoides TaxID=144406 RepID=A0AA39KQ90_9HYME|nr:hypothetical protein PV328_011876 [Microctonus aethiopoides]